MKKSTSLEEPKENKIIAGIRSAVNAKYSVPAWLWAIVSFVVGTLILFVAVVGMPGAGEFLNALPFGGVLVGPLLMAFSGVAMLGMGMNAPKLVRFGSFASFCLWIFVGFAFYASGGILNVFLLPLPMLVFWGYKYLASYVREHDQI